MQDASLLKDAGRLERRCCQATDRPASWMRLPSNALTGCFFFSRFSVYYSVGIFTRWFGLGSSLASFFSFFPFFCFGTPSSCCSTI